jgi:hypothetical protein
MMVVFVPLLQLIIERRAPRLGNAVGVAIVALGLWFLRLLPALHSRGKIFRNGIAPREKAPHLRTSWRCRSGVRT